MNETFEECTSQLVQLFPLDVCNIILDYLSNEFFSYIVRDLNLGNDDCRIGADVMSTSFTTLENALLSLLSKCYAPYRQVHTYNSITNEWTLTEKYVEKLCTLFEIYKVFVNSVSVPAVRRWQFRDGQFWTTPRPLWSELIEPVFMENVPIYKSWKNAWSNKLDALETCSKFNRFGVGLQARSEAYSFIGFNNAMYSM